MIKEKVKALWKLCFEDSEAFIEMYFRLRYNNEVNIAIESGDEVISALQMLPYPMTFCGKQIQTSYISGACTHPDYRGKGVMKELLSQALTKMLHNNVILSTLIVMISHLLPLFLPNPGYSIIMPIWDMHRYFAIQKTIFQIKIALPPVSP